MIRYATICIYICVCVYHCVYLDLVHQNILGAHTFGQSHVQNSVSWSWDFERQVLEHCWETHHVHLHAHPHLNLRYLHISLSLPFPFPLAQISTKTPYYVLSNLVFLLQPSVHPARASAPAWWRTYAVAAALPGPTWRVCDGNPTWQRPRWWDLRWWFANTSPVPLILNTPGKKKLWFNRGGCTFLGVFWWCSKLGWWDCWIMLVLILIFLGRGKRVCLKIRIGCMFIVFFEMVKKR